MNKREIIKKMLETMLKHDIVPTHIEVTDFRFKGGWFVEGTTMGHGLFWNHRFDGTAATDGTFTLTSGAFGQLTETHLDLFVGLEGAGVTNTEDD